MAKAKPADLLFWVLAAAAAAALILFVLVLGGVVPVGSADPPAEAAPAAAPVRPEAGAKRGAPQREQPVVRRVAPEASTTTKAAGEGGPRLVTVVVTATRGDCWLSARAGSETGRVLDERVLLEGESVSVRANRVWLSLGASSNVDVLVDREPRPVPAGTVALVLTPGSTS